MKLNNSLIKKLRKSLPPEAQETLDELSVYAEDDEEDEYDSEMDDEELIDEEDEEEEEEEAVDLFVSLPKPSKKGMTPNATSDHGRASRHRSRGFGRSEY